MPSFSSADQAPGAERTVIAYQPSYPVNQPGTIISYPMMSMPYPVDYGYYPVEQYQVLPGPSAGPSRSLETPPSYPCAPAAPSAAPTSVFTAPTPVVFAPAPSASTVVPVPVPTSAPVSVLITASSTVDPSAPPSVAPPSTSGSVVSLEPPPQNVEPPAASPRVHSHSCSYGVHSGLDYARCPIASCHVKEIHFLILCPIFAVMTHHQKWLLVMFHNLCPVCLSNVHFFSPEKCPYRFSQSGLICAENCDNFHHQILHPEPKILPPISCFSNSDECDCGVAGNYLIWWRCGFSGCKSLNFHEPQFCIYFTSLSPHYRWELVKKNLLCFRCLKPGHRFFNCPELFPAILYKCYCECKTVHHVLLHPDGIPLHKFIYSSVPGLPLVNPELPDSSSDDSSSTVGEDSLDTVSELEDDRLLCRPNVYLSPSDIDFIRFLLQERKRDPSPVDSDAGSSSKLVRSASSSVASVHPPPAVDEQAVHRDQATSPVADEERPVYSSSSSEDSDTSVEFIQATPPSGLLRRPRCFFAQVISRPTLYVDRLPVAIQNNVRLLRQSVQNPHALLREGFSMLCGRRAVRLTLKLNEEQSFPLELESGLNILTWMPNNLRIHPAGMGSARLFGELPEGHFLTYYLDGNYRLVDLDGEPLQEPVFNYYMLGERPKKSGIVKPLPRRGHERGRGDWRMKGWEKALKSHDWPADIPTFYYDIYMHHREVHVCDYQRVTAWPLLKRQYT